MFRRASEQRVKVWLAGSNSRVRHGTLIRAPRRTWAAVTAQRECNAVFFKPSQLSLDLIRFVARQFREVFIAQERPWVQSHEVLGSDCHGTLPIRPTYNEACDRQDAQNANIGYFSYMQCRRLGVDWRHPSEVIRAEQAGRDRLRIVRHGQLRGFRAPPGAGHYTRNSFCPVD